MTGEVSIASLRMRRALRISRIMTVIQSIVILLLLIALSEEYDHNQFFQAWAGFRLGSFAFFLNGTLAAFYAGLLVAYYLSTPAKQGEEQLIEERGEILVEAEAF